MEKMIKWAIDRTPASLTLLFLLLLGGVVSYIVLPKEAQPDMTIPFIYVSVSLEGISPEDGMRLIAKPLEQELASLEGVKRITSTNAEGHTSVLVEFFAGVSADKALNDVKDRVDRAKYKLPQEAMDPQVHEIDMALFPILSVGLSGNISEQSMVYIANRLKDEIESIPEVLSVDISGDRDEMIELVVDPQVLDSYQIDFGTLYQLVSNNNKLVAAGNLESKEGKITLKIPGIISSLEDVLSMPIKVDGETVITFNDVATIRRTFADPKSFARINGKPGLILSVSKRSGSNIVEAVEKTKYLLEEAKKQLPESLEISYLNNQATIVDQLLNELLNNIFVAVILVLIVVMAAMGFRSAFLVGITIPGAFLTGILFLWVMGYTMNLVVLFSLIMVTGMLVDGAIVVSELADRNLSEGMTRKDAWQNAASRMSWPIISSTATTLAVFVPLLFWPGMVGEFMKFMPIVVILCLSASLAMALVFLPVIGNVAGSKKSRNVEEGSSKVGKAYRKLLEKALANSGKSFAGIMVIIFGIYVFFAFFNHGFNFFPYVEPESVQAIIHSRGDASIYEKDAIVKRVEDRFMDMPELEVVYSNSYGNAASNSASADVIGKIFFDLTDWNERRPARKIIADMKQRIADIPGIEVEFVEAETGPTSGKPIVIQLSGDQYYNLYKGVKAVEEKMHQLDGFVDIEDDMDVEAVEWQMIVDREAASRYGVTIASIGQSVKMVTIGLKLSTYRPEDATDELDIRVRVPEYARTLDQLQKLTISTPRGQVPLSQFVTLKPARKVGTIKTLSGKQTVTIKSELADGYLVTERLEALKNSGLELPKGVFIKPAGEDADMQEAMNFLILAFAIAVFLMAFTMILQFNSIYQTLLVLSAIIFSTAGVLLGILVTGQAFGVVMVGMGIIALAGIVVNNNIVLIDTYNELRNEGMSPEKAALETGVLRLRPVFLTAFTTVLGLVPMTTQLGIDLLEPSISIGSPSGQYWPTLASAIAGGLTFATILTLVLTPVMLVLGSRFGVWFRSKFKKNELEPQELSAKN